MTTYLQPSPNRPNPDALSPADSKFIQEHFNVYGGSLTVEGQPVDWSAIEEIEVAVAPHISGPAGWLVRNVVIREERYHVGLYSGRDEIILPNLTLPVAKYIVACIAHFAPLAVRYSGLPDFAPTMNKD
ncbi:MAG: hypothetical protein GC179_21570 [Anaerolineaceae bacterium]|nr:hypothetical protein [Anaerolineaceae bacterium]